jgi:hypothetical protein
MLLFRFWLAFALLASVAYGQWIGYKEKGPPRQKDGKVDLKAPPPKVNGKPDLTGIWLTVAEKRGEAEQIIPGLGILAVPGDDASTFSRHFLSVLADNPDVKMTPSANARMGVKLNADPATICGPRGLPMTDMLQSPRRILQTPKLIAVLYEGHPPRQIHTDGRPLPEDPTPAYSGYSVGKWEGDVLAVETAGFNPKIPLDSVGHPRSEGMRMIERIRRVDYGHLEIDVTLIDDQYYSRPIRFRYYQVLLPDSDLLEFVCSDNEKDAAHLAAPAK